MPAEIKHCTSCGSDQIEVAGNKYLCRICNIVYEVTDTGTKVLDTNPLDKIEQRLANVERKQQGGEPPDTVEQQIDKETAELHELPSVEEIDSETEEDGFIIFE